MSSRLFVTCLFLPRFRLLEELLRVVLEGVPAAGAADVIGLALVRHGNRAQAAADDALRPGLAGGEGLALLGGADLVATGKERLVRRLRFVAVKEAVGMQQGDNQLLRLLRLGIDTGDGQHVLLKRTL